VQVFQIETNKSIVNAKVKKVGSIKLELMTLKELKKEQQ
jgi:uncharacterized protein YqfB (UPF0267 family)